MSRWPISDHGERKSILLHDIDALIAGAERTQNAATIGASTITTAALIEVNHGTGMRKEPTARLTSFSMYSSQLPKSWNHPTLNAHKQRCQYE